MGHISTIVIIVTKGNSFMVQKCMVIPNELICFQWFSNLKSYPDWVKTMPDWAIQRLNNGDWIVQEDGHITWYENEDFHEHFQLIESK